MENKLKQAKKLLYNLLLDKEPDNLSISEVNIMFELSRDSDIQEHFDEVKEFETFETFNTISESNDKCLHLNCSMCHGSGINKEGQSCFHYINCTCIRCNPQYTNIIY